MKRQIDHRRMQRGQSISLADIEALAEQSYACLPAHFRALCEDLVIRVEDFPPPDVLNTMGLRNRYNLLGLFRGVGLPFRGNATGQMPNMIWLYRGPILAYWTAREESLAAIVTHVLVHEIGHHFGFSDADMEAIEAEVD